MLHVLGWFLLTSLIGLGSAAVACVRSGMRARGAVKAMEADDPNARGEQIDMKVNFAGAVVLFVLCTAIVVAFILGGSALNPTG